MSVLGQINIDDIGKYDPVIPGFYLCEVTEVKPAEISKSKKSMNYPFVITIIGNNEKKKDAACGKQIKYYCNSSIAENILDLVACCTDKTRSGILQGFRDAGKTTIDPEKDFDLNALTGKTFFAKVRNEEYEGKVYNRIDDVFPPTEVPF